MPRKKKIVEEVIETPAAQAAVDPIDAIIETPEIKDAQNDEAEIETEIVKPAKEDKKKVEEKIPESVYAFCCVHGGLRFDLPSGKLFLPSANDVSVQNQFLNVKLNPNKYSVTKITGKQMQEIKQRYGNAKFLKNLFVFFHAQSSLTPEQEESVLNKRGKSPWAQLTDEEVAKFGVMKKSDE